MVCTENKLRFSVSDNDSVARGTIAAVAVDYGRMGEQTAIMANASWRMRKAAAMPVRAQGPGDGGNKKAAAAMGVTVPEAVLKKASKIIE
jgi:putative ABC transport system substrate-binding protein